MSHKYHEPDHECRILAKLDHIKEFIMSVVSDFSDKQNAFFDRQDKAITDLQGDVKFLNDTIATLQNSPGTISAADQASLDAIQARASTISDKLDALDALTPPAGSTSGAPVVNSLSPSTGAVGSSVSISVQDSTGTTAVSFGGTAATSFSVANSTTVNAVVPSGSGTVDVVVSNSAGASAVVAAGRFTYA